MIKFYLVFLFSSPSDIKKCCHPASNQGSLGANALPLLLFGTPKPTPPYFGSNEILIFDIKWDAVCKRAL